MSGEAEEAAPAGETQPVPADPQDSDDPRILRRLRILRALAFMIVPALFVGFLAFGMFRSASREGLVGRAGPDFELPVLNGVGTIRTSDLSGQPTVINFWASWCAPCREEAPLMERKWRHYREQGVRFVGINVQDSENDAREFVRDYEVTYPILRDRELRAWTAFGVRGLPETFFLSREWKFVGIGSGAVLGERGNVKIRGAVRAPLLDSQIRRMLETRPSETGAPGE